MVCRRIVDCACIHSVTIERHLKNSRRPRSYLKTQIKIHARGRAFRALLRSAVPTIVNENVLELDTMKDKTVYTLDPIDRSYLEKSTGVQKPIRYSSLAAQFKG